MGPLQDQEQPLSGGSALQFLITTLCVSYVGRVGQRIGVCTWSSEDLCYGLVLSFYVVPGD